MHRRAAIRGLGGVVLGSSLVGCGADDREPERGLTVTETAGQARGSAVIDVAVRVANSAARSETGTVWAELTVFEGETYRQHRSITVAGGETRTLEFTFEISEGRNQWGGYYSYRAWVA